MTVSTPARAVDLGRPVPAGHSSGEFTAVVKPADTLTAGDLNGREAEFASKAAAAEPGTMGSYPEYWRRCAAIEDLIDAPAPAGYNEQQLAGWRSVNRDAINLDDRQPFAWTAWHLNVNEELARDEHAPYRDGHGDEARQAQIDDAWNARADRLAELRELYQKCADWPLDVQLY